MILGKINVEMRSPFDDKENFDALYVNAENLINSETQASLATAIDAYGRALASLSKDSYNDTTVKFDINIDSATAQVPSSDDVHIAGNLQLNVSDMSGDSPINDYWKSTGLIADTRNLFNSETQVAFLNQVNGFANGYCSLQAGSAGGGVEYNGFARIKDYKTSINEILAG